MFISLKNTLEIESKNNREFRGGYELLQRMISVEGCRAEIRILKVIVIGGVIGGLAGTLVGAPVVHDGLSIAGFQAIGAIIGIAIACYIRDKRAESKAHTYQTPVDKNGDESDPQRSELGERLAKAMEKLQADVREEGREMNTQEENLLQDMEVAANILRKLPHYMTRMTPLSAQSSVQTMTEEEDMGCCPILMTDVALTRLNKGIGE